MINLQNKSPKLLVIGDLIIDQYLWGSCERISPEAPVQVINVDRESTVLGGAGNVVNNLKKLGAQVDVISVVGNCEISSELRSLLFDIEVDTKYLRNNNKGKRLVRNNLEEYTLSEGKRVYLIGEGRIANLVAAEGHPPEVMALSFSNQLLSIIHIVKNHLKMTKSVHNVPEEIDSQIAVNALEAMGVKIDKQTQEQSKYAQSWM